MLTQPPQRPAAARPAGLLACYLIWGSTYLAIHLALPSFPPFFQMGTRFLAAGGLLMAWLLARGQALPSGLEWRNALVIGVLMLGGGMGLTAQASLHIGSGLIATFIAVVPMLTCGWGLLFGKRPTRLELLGMATGLVGVGLLVQGASFAAAPVGLLCITGATLAWSLGSVLSTTRLPLAKGPVGFASEMLCGGAALLLLSLALGEQPGWPPTAVATAAWVYLVVAGSLVAFSAYLYLLAHATPALATSYAFVNPLIALFLGVVLAGEVVTAREWRACAVILLGVVCILVAGQKSRKH
ncbi:drug/metabolite exporter YedA [Rhodoferax sp.]|uniref:drug/metabolite exporter YedA n=1 Tax=Rhodoferax sp. TaxID=50421 RepID=UPI0025E06A7A|nr:drug/metabolite exporter YedA [Rhodoferax sp.]